MTFAFLWKYRAVRKFEYGPILVFKVKFGIMNLSHLEGQKPYRTRSLILLGGHSNASNT